MRIEILTPKQILDRLLIALPQIKAEVTNLKFCEMKFVKSYILCIERKKLQKQYNKFNKVIKHNEYYIYEFWK